MGYNLCPPESQVGVTAVLLIFLFCGRKFLPMSSSRHSDPQNASLAYDWGSREPRLGSCERDILLRLVPSFLLFLFSPLEFAVRSKRTKVRWGVVNILRIIVALMVAVIQVLVLTDESSHETWGHDQLTHVSIIVMGISYAWTAVLLILAKYKGFVRSVVVFVFVTMSSICAAVEYWLLQEEEERPAFAAEKDMSHVHLYAVILLWILCWMPDGVDEESLVMEHGMHVWQEVVSRRETASLPSLMSFSWVSRSAREGLRSCSCLYPEDLHPLPPESKAHHLSQRLGQRLDKSKNKNRRPGHEDEEDDARVDVVSCLISSFKLQVFSTGVLRLVTDLMELLKPLTLKWLIDFMSDERSPHWHGMFLVSFLVLVLLVHNVLLRLHEDKSQGLGLQAKAAVTACLYRKALSISSSVRGEEDTAGQTVSLMQQEAQVIGTVFQNMHFLWSNGLQVLLILVLLFQEVGYAVIMIPIFVFVVVYGMIGMTMSATPLKQEESEKRAEQVAHLTELLSGIRVVKMHAWEHAFLTLINACRESELGIIRQVRRLRGLQIAFWTLSSVLLTLPLLLWYSLSEDNPVTASKLFFILSLLHVLYFSLKDWPSMILLFCSTAGKAKDQVNAFLNRPELRQYICRDRDDKNHTLTMEDSILAWIPFSRSVDTSFRLKARLRVPESSLTLIVGPPASGKSSLLSAIMGEMELLSGRINISPDIKKTALVPQEPWIQSGTVKQNIVFGKLYDTVKYLTVVSACDLEQDFLNLPSADMTDVGSEVSSSSASVSLTHSLRQKVSIARACYSDADLYLFDDALAPTMMERRTARDLFHSVLSSKTGLLKKKTRIVVTSDMSLMPEADRIYVLKEGQVVEWGTFDELSNSTEGTFTQLMKDFKDREPETVIQSQASVHEGEDVEYVDVPFIRKDSVRLGRKAVKKQPNLPFSSRVQRLTLRDSNRPSMSGFLSVKRASHVNNNDVSEGSTQQNPQTMSSVESVTATPTPTKKQDKKEAEVPGPGKMRSLLKFLSFMRFSATTTVLLVLMFQLLHACSLISLVNWTEDRQLWSSLHTIVPDDDGDFTDFVQENKGLITYALSALLAVLFALIANMILVSGTTTASRRMQDKVLSKLIGFPVSFFEDHPLDRLLRPFVKDLKQMEDMVFDDMMGFVLICMMVMVNMALLSLVFPVLLFSYPVIIVLFLLIVVAFIRTDRQVREMESNAQSFMLSDLRESLTGTSTIRAFGACERFLTQSEQRIDRTNICSNTRSNLMHWRSFRLELLSSFLLILVSLTCSTSRGQVESGFAGLAFLVSQMLLKQLHILTSCSSSLVEESEWLEQGLEFYHRSEEPDWHCDVPPPDFWPPHGAVRFYDVSARYRPEDQLAIRNVNFLILPHEKVGVVGRDGAGKSTLGLLLLRMMEPSHGHVVVDGIEVATIGLHDLRSRVSIVPRDPLLLSGSVRRNLDPFDHFSDSDLWSALESTHLKDLVTNMSGKLDHPLLPQELSMSQRQLLCLSRAVVCKRKILLLDEATAVVDQKTASLIHSVVKSEFADSTVINIAHDLKSVLEVDRVLVMDEGRVAEFDSPSRLLEDADSLFHAMAKEAGAV